MTCRVCGLPYTVEHEKRTEEETAAHFYSVRDRGHAVINNPKASLFSSSDEEKVYRCGEAQEASITQIKSGRACADQVR